MLDSTARRPAFDAFFASLDTASRTVFLDYVTAQWEGLSEDHPCSVIDCMENVWDSWRELRHYNPAHMTPDERSILGVIMNCPEREEREYVERSRRGLKNYGPPRCDLCHQPLEPYALTESGLHHCSA